MIVNQQLALFTSSQFVYTGVQKRDVRCVVTKDNTIVSDEACDPLTKPHSSKKCNTQPCEPEYVRYLLF